MTIKIATATFALVLLVAGAQEATGHRLSGLSPDQPLVVIAGDVGPAAEGTGAAAGDSEALVLTPEQPERVIERIDAAGPSPSEFPISGSPHFVAEPEDPTKVRFIAEPEDLVCFLPVADGAIQVCDLRAEPDSVPVPGYEPVP